VHIAISEFVDEFLKQKSPKNRLAMLSEEPNITGAPFVDAMVAGVAEYLAKQHRLGGVPPWTAGKARFLAEPWFTTETDAPGMREYLTWSSPVEFSRRNIFTTATPLTRAASRS
jgi:hypothetical protein